MTIYVLEVEGLNTGFAYFNQFRADVWAANDPENRSYSTVTISDAEEGATLFDLAIPQVLDEDEDEEECPLCG
jgi:hypothetical protein